jgi:hypothetical protein
VSPAANLFRVGAFVALALLVRYTWRTEGARAAAIFTSYLVGFAVLRECLVWSMQFVNGGSPPFSTDSRMGHLGPVNLVVVSGWVFTALLSFAVARMIQRNIFRGTNVFLTLTLAAVVTSTISYAVEVTGMRVPLWRWGDPLVVAWLPFDWPEDAFEGWATTSFLMLVIYSATRYRLFAPTGRGRAAVAALVLGVLALAIVAERWTGHAFGPWRPLMGVFMAISAWLGFVAPRTMLGSSGAALRDPD